MTDYAVVVMTTMSQGEGGTHTATSLAERTGLPAPTVAKILKLLARDGLMASHRGAAGGYSLARDPDDINVAQIIAAIDGPIALTDCVDGAEGACGVQSLCPRRGNWDRVNRAVRTALEGVSLTEMSQPVFPQAVSQTAAPLAPRPAPVAERVG
ncbi:FeS assembly SUF system regulator [Nitrospirillum iridis]|uniref:FeS assembly SUF system regulator n=2 Tax=Nitrospirillum iridis TaxID=765888 RepID=A0A7X0B1D7_9PROT|nr:FeS assembly SUF system regulator [Nitrospirillum iridis]